MADLILLSVILRPIPQFPASCNMIYMDKKVMTYQLILKIQFESCVLEYDYLQLFSVFMLAFITKHHDSFLIKEMNLINFAFCFQVIR